MTTMLKTKKAVSQAVFSNPTKASVQAIREDQLVSLLMANKGATAVTIVARTEPDMRKTGNPYIGQVFKVSRVNGFIGFRYENAVNNQLAREGEATDFVAKPRSWGVHVPGTPLVEHKGNYYVELKVEKSLDHRFEDASGNELDDATLDLVKQFIPVKNKPMSQGTEKEVICRDYKVATILSITYRGTCYLVTH